MCSPSQVSSRSRTFAPSIVSWLSLIVPESTLCSRLPTYSMLLRKYRITFEGCLAACLIEYQKLQLYKVSYGVVL